MTNNQRRALIALQQRPWSTPRELAAHLSTSPQGAAQTASSMVKSGLVERDTAHGFVRYRLTVRGRDVAALNAMRSGGVR